MKLFSTFATAAAALLLATPALGDYTDEVNGKYRVYVPETAQDSCTAILHGVGTMKSVSEYNNMANALLTKGYVVVIMDPQKGSWFKNDVKKMRDGILEVKSNLNTWQTTCTVNKWVVGGHSAGGGTVHAAMSQDPTLADAIMSMDPYEIKSDKGELSTPGLYFGFDRSTCQVQLDKAAEGSYGLTTGTDHRVLARISNVDPEGACGSRPTYMHCSITDNNCLFCSACTSTPQHFYDDFATVVHTFIENENADAVHELQLTTPIAFFTGNDPIARSNYADFEDGVYPDPEPFSPLAGVGIGAVAAFAVSAGVGLIVMKRQSTATVEDNTGSLNLEAFRVSSEDLNNKF